MKIPMFGRVPELQAVERAVTRLVDRQGGVLALVGTAGVGKSRLAREAVRGATELNMTVLTGRAVANGASTPYRPLTEALAPWARLHGPTAVDLGAHARALDVLIPGWAVHATDPMSPVFVAESLLRLLPHVSADAPVLLLIEDLHWADEETLAAVEYLADAVERLPVLLVMTSRDDEGAAARRLLRALAARGSARLLQLGPLDLDATRQLAEAHLGEPASEALARLLVERADGLPLFVEELVLALAAAGALAPSAAGVDVTPTTISVLPATVADTVATRLDGMSVNHREVLESAALLGRSFDHDVLVTAYGEDVIPALSVAAELGLLHEDPDRPGKLRFRHALLRDGVLASTFPPRRSALARTLLNLLLQHEPTGDELSVAVELAARAGDTPLAARLAIRRAVAAYDRWALATAEQGLAEARHFAGGDRELVTGIDLQQLRVASLAGRIDVVERVGRALLTRGGNDVVLVESHLRLAQALLDDERAEEAEPHLVAAFPLVHNGGDACTVTRLELESSTLALLSGDAELARDRAVRAAELARPYDDQVDLVCAALLHEGRAWLPEVATARARWAAGIAIADAHGMRLWRGRLLTELAGAAADELHGQDELREAAELAHEAGAVELLTRVSLLQARLALLRGDLDEANGRLRDAEQRGHSTAGSRRTAAELRSALALLGGEEAAGLSPQLRVLEALVADDLDAARDAAASVTHRGPLSALTDVVADAPASAAVADARAMLPNLAGAVARLRAAPLIAALFTRVWAASATDIRQPLQAAIATLDSAGLGRPADGCRALLRAAGVPLPRRPAEQEGVPDHLRAAGVTARELDVLRLLAEGQSNRDVAAALYLSPRTVEKHVERLLLKTGAANRTALAALARDRD